MNRRHATLGTRSLSWLHRWMLAKGLPMHPEPLEAAFIRALYDRPTRP